jgi:hypothetical protein
MNLHKIAGILGLVVALAGAFVPGRIPYEALMLLVLGLVVGHGVTAEHNVRVIVTAMALGMLSPSFEAVPGAGEFLTTFVRSVGHVVAGAALFVIFNNIYHRLVDK